MERKKNTHVIALTDMTAVGNSAVRHALSLAAFFEAGLIVVPRFSLKKEKTFSPVNAEFQQIIDNAPSTVKVQVEEREYLLPELHEMAESVNGIMFVIGVARKGEKGYFDKSRAEKFIAPSRLPVMTVGSEPPRDEKWQNVLLPVEIDRPAKEKALWAGYFNRFGKSTVHILHNIYKDTISKDKMEDIQEFIDKLYRNLEIVPEKHELATRADDIDSYALHHAREFDASVLVIMTTTHKTFVDVLFGTRERELVANPERLPVLCINERDDLFVLCT